MRESQTNLLKEIQEEEDFVEFMTTTKDTLANANKVLRENRNENIITHIQTRLASPKVNMANLHYKDNTKSKAILNIATALNTPMSIQRDVSNTQPPQYIQSPNKTVPRIAKQQSVPRLSIHCTPTSQSRPPVLGS